MAKTVKGKMPVEQEAVTQQAPDAATKQKIADAMNGINNEQATAAGQTGLKKTKSQIESQDTRSRIWDSLDYSYGVKRKESNRAYDRAYSQADNQMLSRGMQRSSYGAQTLANVTRDKIAAEQNIYDAQVADYGNRLQEIEAQELQAELTREQIAAQVQAANISANATLEAQKLRNEWEREQYYDPDAVALRQANVESVKAGTAGQNASTGKIIAETETIDKNNSWIDKLNEADLAAKDAGTKLTVAQIDKIIADTGATLSQTEYQDIINKYAGVKEEAEIGKLNADTGLIKAQTEGENIDNATRGAMNEAKLANLKATTDEILNNIDVNNQTAELNAMKFWEGVREFDATMDLEDRKFVLDEFATRTGLDLQTAAQLLDQAKFGHQVEEDKIADSFKAASLELERDTLDSNNEHWGKTFEYQQTRDAIADGFTEREIALAEAKYQTDIKNADESKVMSIIDDMLSAGEAPSTAMLIAAGFDETVAQEAHDALTSAFAGKNTGGGSGGNNNNGNNNGNNPPPPNEEEFERALGEGNTAENIWAGYVEELKKNNRKDKAKNVAAKYKPTANNKKPQPTGENKNRQYTIN